MATMIRPLSSRMALHFGTIMSGAYGRPPQMKSRSVDLDFVVQVIHDVKNFVVVLQIFNRPPGKNHFQPSDERLPFIISMRIVRQQKTASQQILAEPRRLVLRQIPSIAMLHVNPRPVEQFVGVRVDNLFHSPRMQPRKAPHAHCELPVRFRIIRRPELETPEAAIIIVRSEMVTRKCPFRVLMRIGGKRRSSSSSSSNTRP